MRTSAASISLPRMRGDVFTADDLVGVKPIRAVSGLPGFKISEQPPLAAGKVRHVGELVAMCVAATRADAEDIAASVRLDLDELPAVHDMLAGRAKGAPLLHESWGDNIFLETNVEVDIAKALARPDQGHPRDQHRPSMPGTLEGRGVVVHWDSRLEQLVVYTATQMPHIVRTGLSECLGLDHGKIRVVSPDVGGGFWLQGHPAARRGRAVLARHALRASGALDRGPARASDGQRELPRASLPHHRLRRPRRPPAGNRLRGDRRFRSLFLLSVLGLP